MLNTAVYCSRGYQLHLLWGSSVILRSLDSDNVPSFGTIWSKDYRWNGIFESLVLHVYWRKMTVEKYQNNEMEKLGERVISLVANYDGSSRHVITVSGVPGSGKSTVTQKLMQYLSSKTKDVVLLLQDGFHYYLSDLRKMPNAEEAIARRGAPFTFDTDRFCRLVNDVKYNLTDTIHAPDFSHEKKDPQENVFVIEPHHKVIIVEGNYVNLNRNGWEKIGGLATEKWAVTTNMTRVRDRLIHRHIEAGISATVKEAASRVDSNDLINGAFVLNNSAIPNVVIEN